MEIEKLIEIAQDINMLSEAAQLCLIKQRSEDDNCELILPIIGEFSAGKTTLINALTDSKKLETASRPTTATIYEIHFGCDSCYAEVFDEEGNKKRIDDIGRLANNELKDSLVVRFLTLLIAFLLALFWLILQDFLHLTLVTNKLLLTFYPKQMEYCWQLMSISL